ncbi:MAG: hypothetical protein NTZ17_02450 [Phycisphaerae bacterium]|nr:hypothetical protein [Phycisphaerae bacterium]
MATKSNQRMSKEELELHLKGLEREYELARLGMIKGQGATRMGVAGALVTTVLSFTAFFLTGKSLLTGTHLVIIVLIIAASLVIFSSFVFGRAARIRAEISKTKKSLEIVSGDKVR